jgi:hypothetical protein
VLAGAVVMTAVAATRPAQAQTTRDDRAIFTFSSPVAIPGATLPAGDYIFRLVDPDTSRNVVQVLGVEGKVYGMFFTERIMRPTPVAGAEVNLGEAAVGEVRSISSWWQPGETVGRSFLYRPGEASWQRDTRSVRAGD